MHPSTSTATATVAVPAPKFSGPICKSTGKGKAFDGPTIAQFKTLGPLVDAASPAFEAACMGTCSKDIRCGYWLVHKQQGCVLKAKKMRSAQENLAVVRHGVCLYHAVHAECKQTHAQMTYKRYGRSITPPSLTAIASSVFPPAACSKLCADTTGCLFWRSNAAKGCQMYASVRDPTLVASKKTTIGACSGSSSA